MVITQLCSVQRRRILVPAGLRLVFFFVNAARSTGDFYWVDLPGGPYLQLSRMWLQCK